MGRFSPSESKIFVRGFFDSFLNKHIRLCVINKEVLDSHLCGLKLLTFINGMVLVELPKFQLQASLCSEGLMVGVQRNLMNLKLQMRGSKAGSISTQILLVFPINHPLFIARIQLNYHLDFLTLKMYF